MMNYTNGYGYNPYSTPQFNGLQNQYQQPQSTIMFVSNVAEAIATKPDVTGKPLFFYNKADEEVYIKQYDNTGAAPVKTYKLVIENIEPQDNPIANSIKGLNQKLDDIKKLLTPEIIEEAEKRSKK